MSRRRTVLGTYKKITGGDHNMSSEGHIISKAVLNVGEKGTEIGVTHNSFERLGSNVNEDFEINFSRNKDKDYSTVVPLGILDFSGKSENAQFVFDYSLLLSNIDSLEFKVLNEDWKCFICNDQHSGSYCCSNQKSAFTGGRSCKKETKV